MTDQPIQPQFVDEMDAAVQYPVRAAGRAFPRPIRPVVEAAPAQKGSRRLAWLNTVDKPLLIVVSLLLAMGMMMVYSTTFDWSNADWGSSTYMLMRHIQNVAIGLGAMAVFFLIDYRLMRRLAVVIILMAISFLISVLIFGDDTFGARRALINGRFQPGEFSELAIIIYMAAWLGSKNTLVRSLTYGFIPFMILVGIVGALVVAQPDLSTAAVIAATSFVMFFLAGADMRQITLAIAAVMVLVIVAISFNLMPNYAVDRIEGYVAGLRDPLQTSYHTQGALNALYTGGWTGVGLGESVLKFEGLPAPHTDSIFAVIGEELGVVGATMVLLMYVAFVIRGFQIARRALDPFGALLAAGVSVWVATKALLNISVMTALLPPTGVPLPLISFGGSSLVVLLAGVGLLLGVQRGTIIRQSAPERRVSIASYDRGGRDRRTRVPRTGRS